jgi:hypothetical protein
MSVEMNIYYEGKATGRLDLYGSYTIPPGGCEGVVLGGKEGRMLVVCGPDDKRGSVLIKNPKKSIEVQRYERMDKVESQKMDLSSKNIKIVGAQGFVISAKEENEYIDVKIYISLNSSNNNQSPKPILGAS